MMSQPTNGPTKKLNMQLWCGPVFVGELLDVIVDQGTWFALSFRQAVNRKGGQGETRICDFIDFCEDWHQRVKREMEPSATEFDPFLAELRNWRVRSLLDGREMEVDTPVFADGLVSWIRPKPGDPNPSKTAWGEWCSLTGHDPNDFRVN